MIWYDSRPKDTFEDPDSKKLIDMLSSMDTFGIILKKKESALTLYLGTEETESHHITSILDISAILCEPPALPLNVTSMKLKNDPIHPLCANYNKPVICHLYEQSTMLSDFIFGMVGKRTDAKGIIKRGKSFLDKVKKRESKGQFSPKILDPIQAKMKETSFFATTIFFSCAPEIVPAFLSSVNFTNKFSQPNALVSKTKLRGIRALKPPGSSLFGGGKTPILSPIELASVLSFPPGMFGLEMISGTDKTFSNVRGVSGDPADFFTDLTAEGKIEKEIADEKEKLIAEEVKREDTKRAEKVIVEREAKAEKAKTEEENLEGEQIEKEQESSEEHGTSTETQTDATLHQESVRPETQSEDSDETPKESPADTSEDTTSETSKESPKDTSKETTPQPDTAETQTDTSTEDASKNLPQKPQPDDAPAVPPKDPEGTSNNG